MKGRLNLVSGKRGMVLALVMSMPFVFSTMARAGDIELSHQWSDWQGNASRLLITLSEERVRQGLTQAGDFYSMDTIFSHLIKHARLMAEDLTDSNVVLTVAVSGSSYVVQSDYREGYRMVAAQRRSMIEQYIENGFMDLNEISYYRRDGNRNVYIDYNRIINDFSDMIGASHDYFQDKVDHLGEEDQINERLRFLQSITYDDLLDNDFQLMTPLRMLAEGRGDCESKQLFFAGLLKTRWPDRNVYLVALYDKEHIVTAMEFPHGSRSDLLAIGGKSYLIMDATGPAFSRAKDSMTIASNLAVDGIGEKWHEIILVKNNRDWSS